MVSYMVAGVTCIFAALCYAEFASMAPVAGSAYTYAYYDAGRAVRLDHRLGSGARIRRRGGHGRQWLVGLFPEVLAKFGIHVPDAFSKAPLIYDKELAHRRGRPDRYQPAGDSLIIAIITVDLVKGISRKCRLQRPDGLHQGRGGAVRHSRRRLLHRTRRTGSRSHPTAGRGLASSASRFAGQTNAAASRSACSPGRPSSSSPTSASIRFRRTPKRPRIRSATCRSASSPRLLICTILYIAVVAVLTGMVQYDQIDKDAGVSQRASTQSGLPWAEFIIAAAGVAGITSVLLVMMLSGPRVFLAMARDGLVPDEASSPTSTRTFQTPWKSTIAHRHLRLRRWPASCPSTPCCT